MEDPKKIYHYSIVNKKTKEKTSGVISINPRLLLSDSGYQGLLKEVCIKEGYIDDPEMDIFAVKEIAYFDNFQKV